MNDENAGAVARLLLGDDLSKILERAEGGDKLAARDALQSLAFLLSTANRHPSTGNPLPVPGYVRDYLSRAFYRMAYQAAMGENKIDAEKALNLKGGPSAWGHYEKRLAADLVHRFVIEGLPIADTKDGNDATTKAAEIINGFVHGNNGRDCPQAWMAFQNNSKVSSATLKSWYHSLKAEIEKIHNRQL